MTATISCYEQRHPASTIGIDAFCRKSDHSWLEHYTTWARRRPNKLRNLSLRTQVGRPSGRQDSNLRPLVPQTSPHFLDNAEFDLECFRREMVGMTTRAPNGIRWTSVDIHRGLLSVPHLPSSPIVLVPRTGPHRNGATKGAWDDHLRLRLFDSTLPGSWSGRRGSNAQFQPWEGGGPFLYSAAPDRPLRMSIHPHFRARSHGLRQSPSANQVGVDGSHLNTRLLRSSTLQSAEFNHPLTVRSSSSSPTL